MDVTLILSGSTFLQFLAAAMALRLVWVSEKRLGWALVATAILFMAGRRGINLVAYLGGEQTSSADIAAEWMALCISLLMVVGIRLIAPMAFSARRTRKTLLTRFGRILDESFNEIYIFDAHTLKFLQTNRGARLNLGYSTEELLELTPFDLKPDFSRSRFESTLSPLKSGKKESLFFETRHQRKDGTLYPIEVRLQASEMDGSPVFVAIILDITERKEAEQALRKSQTLTEELLENIPAFIFIKDLDGRYLMANKYFEDELALTQDQILGKTDFEIFPEEIARSFVENDQEVLVSKSKKVFEEIIPFADGLHTSITTKFPIKNKLGEISGICGIVVDITDRKKAEQALTASEQMLQTVLDTIPTRVFWKDRDLNYLGGNTPFLKDAGLESLQEIVGKDDHAMCWREQAESYRADDRQVIQSGIPKIDYEETQTLADGSLAWVRTSKIPLQDMEGN
ncbi:MAG: PAS domain S-box protein, partial [Nitrospinae bacterium]|nr:PAS domain S-box protein [Nitrospinota bacterium]